MQMLIDHWGVFLAIGCVFAALAYVALAAAVAFFILVDSIERSIRKVFLHFMTYAKRSSKKRVP